MHVLSPVVQHDSEANSATRGPLPTSHTRRACASQQARDSSEMTYEILDLAPYIYHGSMRRRLDHDD